MTNPQPNGRPAHIAVVVPCYRVAGQIARVIRGIPDWVRTIVCVDDCSPDDSGERLRRLGDPRVVVLRHEHNQGVGGAVVTGYRECLRRGADIIVKMDGDDQMDAGHLPTLVEPLLVGQADYAKGNRWADLERLQTMPAVRRLGNLALSFAIKLCSGHWQIFDPCNGYTAIRAGVLRQLPLDRLAADYYFETSMLVQLNVARAVVQDVPIPARYADEKSSLRIGRVLRRFPAALLRSLLHRIWHRHFLRDFGPCALFLASGLVLIAWSLVFGGWHWLQSAWTQTPATAGTVMLAALPFLMGFQLLLQASVLEMNQRDRAPLCQHDPLQAPWLMSAQWQRPAA
jgi:dolichol-phosphate mannosyltransferase